MSTIMVRAELTPEQWKDLRKLAIDLEVSLQDMIGGALVDYLYKNGFKYDEESVKA